MNMTVKHAAILAILGASCLSPPHATAGDFKLFLSYPYDIQNGAFNLNQLETMNLAPYVNKRLFVNFADQENRIRQLIEDKVGGHRELVIKCYTDWGPFGKTDSTCPDLRAKLDFSPTVQFTRRSQPTIVKKPGDRFVFAFDTEAEIGLNVSVTARVGDGAINWGDSEFQVNIRELVSLRAEADLTLFPDMRLNGRSVEMKLVDGNVQVNGLTNDLMELGAEYGFVIGGQVGALIGTYLGKAGAEKLEAAIKAEVNRRVQTAFNDANRQFSELATGLIDIEFQKAKQAKDGMMARQIFPGMPFTADVVLQMAGADVKLYSQITEGALGSNLTAAVVARMNPLAGSNQIVGAIRMPNTTCQYAGGGNEAIGYLHFPVGVIETNQDLKAGQSCSAILHEADVAVAAYRGEDPNKYFTGKGDVGLTWRAIGRFVPTGTVTEANKYYECGYTIKGLPEFSILDLGTASQEFAKRLGHEHLFRFRMLLAKVAGKVYSMDAHGQAMDIARLDLGGPGPTTTADCPAYRTQGKGFMESLSRIKTRLDRDPATCPMCGTLDVFKFREDMVNPSPTQRQPVLPQLGYDGPLGIPNSNRDAPGQQAGLAVRPFTPMNRDLGRLVLPEVILVKGVGKPPVNLDAPRGTLPPVKPIKPVAPSKPGTQYKPDQPVSPSRLPGLQGGATR